MVNTSQLRRFDTLDKPHKARSAKPKADHKAKHVPEWVEDFLSRPSLDESVPVLTLSGGRLIPIVEGHCGDVWDAVEGFLAGWRVIHPELYEGPENKPPKLEIVKPTQKLAPMVLVRTRSAWAEAFYVAHNAAPGSTALRDLIENGTPLPEYTELELAA